MQNKKGSLLEVLFSTLFGYTINLLATVWIYPKFGYHVTLRDNLMIGVYMTFVSVFRSYVIRRIFNFLGSKGYFVK